MPVFDIDKAKRPDRIDDIHKCAVEFQKWDGDNIIYCTDEERYFVYKDGVYKPLNGRVKEKCYFKDRANDNKDYEYIMYFSHAKFLQFIEWHKTECEVDLEDMNRENIINFKNGVYDLYTDEFMKHSPEYLSTRQLPYNYDSEAQCPIWHEFLYQTLEGDMDKINLLQEYMGYCLGRDTQFQKALFLIGEAGAGKGVIIRTIEKMVGRENHCTLTLADMGNPQK
jgi:putative DNA primase/helicase